MSLRILCETCQRRYRWVRSQCPHCFQPNGKRFSLILGTLLVVTVAAAAIWFMLHLLADTESGAASAPPGAEEPSGLKRIFSTPAPEPQQEVDFKK